MSSSETLTSEPTRLEPWRILEPHLEFDFPPEWLEFLNGLLRDTGDTPERLFRRALGLYRLALDAQAEGKRVGATDSAECLTEEFEF
jgi:hypothetical protein